MPIANQGYKIRCDLSPCAEIFGTDARTERTAITHARAAGWFVGRIKITIGGRGGRRIVACPGCRWLIGAES